MEQMSDLKAARREEGAAIAALFITGWGLHRLLETIAADDSLPREIRARARNEAANWSDGCRRYAQASAARAIARQTAVPRGDRRRKKARA
jgi:hypothetical protein